jgi:hypothetical protein
MPDSPMHSPPLLPFAISARFTFIGTRPVREPISRIYRLAPQSVNTYTTGRGVYISQSKQSRSRSGAGYIWDIYIYEQLKLYHFWVIRHPSLYNTSYLTGRGNDLLLIFVPPLLPFASLPARAHAEPRAAGASFGGTCVRQRKARTYVIRRNQSQHETKASELNETRPQETNSTVRLRPWV